MRCSYSVTNLVSISAMMVAGLAGGTGSLWAASGGTIDTSKLNSNPVVAGGDAGVKGGGVGVGKVGEEGAGAEVRSVVHRPSVEAFERAFPGVRVYEQQGRVTGLGGVPMTRGRDAVEAAGRFVNQWGGVWSNSKIAGGVAGEGNQLVGNAQVGGQAGMEIRAVRVNDTGDGMFTIFSYEQVIDGVPVDLGYARVVVRNHMPRADGLAGEESVVVYAGFVLGQLAQGQNVLNPKVIDGADALKRVQGMAAYKALPTWGEAREVVYFGNQDGPEWRNARRAWSFVGENLDLNNRVRFVFFVDSTTGELLSARYDLYHMQPVSANVRGFASQGVFADGTGPTPSPAIRGIPGARLVFGTSSGFSDIDGFFTSSESLTGPVTISVDLAEGQFFRVVDNAGAGIAGASTQVSPGGTAELTLNEVPTEFVTSQVNAFANTFQARGYFRSRAPSFTALDPVRTINVNLNQTCNAFFDPGALSTNYFRSGGGCSNSAFSTVVAHEFGHYIVNRLGLAQGAFGEGFGDTIAIMTYDVGRVGEGFRPGGGLIRDPEAANQQYPCSSSAIHTCGQILGGSWRELRLRLGTVYGSGLGLERARQLQVNWALATIGGIGLNSAHPQTLTEVLTLNDNNGDLGDGTPDFTSICNAFSEHGLVCTQIAAFSFPEGRPTFASTDGSTRIRVSLTEAAGEVLPGNVELLARVDDGSFVLRDMVQVGPNLYEEYLPAVECGSRVDWFVRARDTAGTVRADPTGAPTTVRTASAGSANVSNVDSFSVESGWTVGGAGTGDNATVGLWTRMATEGTTAQPGQDVSPSADNVCWVTDGRAGTSAGQFDLDGGRTTLTSPVIDLSGASDARISYWRWYSNSTGASPNLDVFTVLISNDNGANWSTLEVVGPTNTGPGWNRVEVRVADVIVPTAQMRVRFVAEDLAPGSIVEASIDDFTVSTTTCTNACLADVGAQGGVSGSDGVLDNNDFAAFIGGFFEQNRRMDVGSQGGARGGDGRFDNNDFAAFITLFFAGCV